MNNGQYNPLERLAFLRSVFFPQVGQTTGGQVRPVRSQADGGAYPEFVENVMLQKQSVMFATAHVVGSNNGLEPWIGISPTASCASPRPDRIAEFERRQAASLAWLDEVFAAAAGTRGLFLLIQANPYNLPSSPQCPGGFQAFLDHLQSRAQQYARPVVLADPAVTLDALCELFGVIPHDRHTASGDAFITAQVFLRLLRLAARSGRGTLAGVAEAFEIGKPEVA